MNVTQSHAAQSGPKDCGPDFGRFSSLEPAKNGARFAVRRAARKGSSRTLLPEGGAFVFDAIGSTNNVESNGENLSTSGAVTSGGLTCQAAVVSLEDLDAARSENRMCEILEVQRGIFSVDWATPVSERAYKSLSYHVRLAKTNGILLRMTQEKKPVDACDMAKEQEAKSRLVKGMTLDDFSGPILFLVFCMVISILCRYIRRGLQKIHSAQGPKKRRRMLILLYRVVPRFTEHDKTLDSRLVFRIKQNV